MQNVCTFSIVIINRSQNFIWYTRMHESRLTEQCGTNTCLVLLPSNVREARGMRAFVFAAVRCGATESNAINILIEFKTNYYSCKDCCFLLVVNDHFLINY